MRMLTFAKRCAKEILRDPLNLGFGLGFPLVLLFLLSAIQANVPVELFAIAHLAPGIAVFGLSFLTLFSATLIARDRDNLLLAGRCLSGDFYPHASYRMMGNMSATGEAAGFAAMYALRNHISLTDIPPQILRERMKEYL